mgnify:CR=1 FL=1
MGRLHGFNGNFGMHVRAYTYIRMHGAEGLRLASEYAVLNANYLMHLLKDTYHRKGVYNRVDAIRSELDEWTQREYNHAELPNEQFFDLYYHESGSTFARALAEADRERHVQSLAHAKKLLGEHYPDCPPLRSLLKKVDAAVKSLRDWN